MYKRQLLGHFAPDRAIAMKPFGDGFIRLIGMVVTPIIFCTVVSGIAGMHDLRRVGRVEMCIRDRPKATDFGFPNEEAAFALQYGHGIGLAIWEKPVISRLVSLDHPQEIKPGMVFALETFCLLYTSDS